MLWIYLLLLIIILFGGLLYSFQHVLTRKISKATNHLHDLSKDYAAKEEEANQLLEKAQKEARAILAKETQAATEEKEKLIKEAQEQREQIINEANKKGEEITEKAERNAKFLKNQVEEKINEAAREKVSHLLVKVIPKDFLEDIHAKWVEDADKGSFDFKSLKLPENIKEAKVTSAFALSDAYQKDLKSKLKKKVGREVDLKMDVDPMLIAGFVLTIGSVVIDVSLRHKIQKSMQEVE